MEREKPTPQDIEKQFSPDEKVELLRVLLQTIPHSHSHQAVEVLRQFGFEPVPAFEPLSPEVNEIIQEIRHSIRSNKRLNVVDKNTIYEDALDLIEQHGQAGVDTEELKKLYPSAVNPDKSVSNLLGRLSYKFGEVAGGSQYSIVVFRVNQGSEIRRIVKIILV